MGYASRQKYHIKCYSPTDDIVVNNAAEKSYVGTAWYLIKTIQLAAPIVAQSLFRFKFDLCAAYLGTAYGQIYRNGVAVGTVQYQLDSWVTTTEDINTTTWVVGDYIDLWVRAGTGYSQTVYVRNFKICGIGSEFENTLGM